MKNTGPTFSFRQRALSFKFAFQGVAGLIRSEHNAWIHSMAAILAVTLGLILNISVQEWITIVILISMVLAGEAFNSSIEALADHASPEHHPLIGQAKDYAAGGVLLLAIGALTAGCIIFIPKLIELFS